jgi:hypothetical protein
MPYMIQIDNKLISDDVVKEHFACDLNACKGACCIAGDGGAPLLKDELSQLEKAYPVVKHLLGEEAVKVIETEGLYVEDEEGHLSTPLLPNMGPCVYTIFDEKGFAWCAIEKMWKEGKVSWQKPISCHLYPIRVTELRSGDLALNYDRWSICSDACKRGDKEKIRVYQFLKEPIIRQFGEEFYEQLDGVSKYLDENPETD